MRNIKRAFASMLICVLFVAVAGCKSQAELNDIREQQTSKTTQEIVIKQELEREVRVLTVTGTGSVNVAPDAARVSLSVYADSETADEVKLANNEIMANVIAAIKQYGVTDDNIQTDEITVMPIYDGAKNPPEITGYSAMSTVSLVILNVKRVGEVLDAAVSAGAAVALPLEFYLVDETAAYQEALSAAVADAQAKANLMAETAELEIKGPMLISEEYDETNSASNVLLYEGVVPNKRDEQEEGEEQENPPTPIQAGRLKVEAKVTAEFEVEWPAG